MKEGVIEKWRWKGGDRVEGGKGSRGKRDCLKKSRKIDGIIEGGGEERGGRVMVRSTKS